MARLGSGTTTDITSTSNELYYAGEAFRLAYDVGAGTGSRRTQTNFVGNVITATAIAVEVTNNDLSTAAPLGQCTIGGNTTSTTFAGCTGTWVQNTPVDLVENILDISVRDGECKLNGITLADVSLATEATCTPAVPVGECNVSDVLSTTTQAECDNLSGTWTTYTWTENALKAAGKFYVYIPRTILADVGFTVAPQPGTPLYIAYSITYTESDDANTGDAETRVVETDVIGFRWTPMFTI